MRVMRELQAMETTEEKSLVASLCWDDNERIQAGKILIFWVGGEDRKFGDEAAVIHFERRFYGVGDFFAA